MIPLTLAAVGEENIIKRVGGAPGIKKHLEDMGFLAGGAVTLIAAIGAIRREMNSAKWTWFAIGYQCGFAYVISLIVYQIGAIFASDVKANAFGIIVAALLVAGLCYMLFHPYKEATKLEKTVQISK